MDPGDHRSVPLGELPRCSKCNSLLRPHIVWFGESLDHEVFQSANRMIDNCDLLLVVSDLRVNNKSLIFPVDRNLECRLSGCFVRTTSGPT